MEGKARRIWSRGEDEYLVETAKELSEGALLKTDLYQALSERMKGRSAEAVKKRLQKLGWHRSKPSRYAPGPREREELPMAPGSRKASGKSVWTKSEEEEVMECATRAWSEGMSKGELARRVADTLGKRSSDAIAKRLRALQWSPPQVVDEQSEASWPGSGAANTSATQHEGGSTDGLDQHGKSVTDTPHSSREPPPDLRAREINWRRDIVEYIMRITTGEDPTSTMIRGIASKMKTAADQPEVVEEDLNRLGDSLFPDRWVTGTRTRPGFPTRNKRDLWRAQYASIQRLYKLKRKDAAHSILNGSWKAEFIQARPAGLEEYWRGVLESPRTELMRETTEEVDWKWDILDPISEEEARWALRSLRRSTAGVDKVTADELLKWERGAAAGLMNTLLAAGMLPKALSTARITLIPKIEAPTLPNDFRPISIAPIFTRALHKILAVRLRDSIDFSETQYAFLKRDGCLEASHLLQAILRQAHEEARPTAMLLLDLSKAFDTVEHNAILRAATRAKIPPPFLRYLRNQYGTAKVRLVDLVIPVNRGVRQGDPLSPLLFNLVMEEVTSYARKDLGIMLGPARIDSMAYADDLILVANDPWELQAKLEGLLAGLRRVGLHLNSKKSRSITIMKDGKRKHMVLSPTKYHTEDGEISVMDTDEQARYLGLTFTWKGMVKPKHTGKLQNMLEELRKGPLKPYQRLEVLRDFAILRLTHELVLGMAHRNTLKAMDRMVRAAVRTWL